MRIIPIRSAIAIMLATATFALSLPSAYAEEEDEVDSRVSEAMSACLANNLEKGIGILAQLYAETQDALWVFNQARCYQQNDKLEDARKRFLEFRRKNRRKDKARDARALEYVAEIDKELERRDRNAAQAAAAAKTVEPPKVVAAAPAPAIPAYVPPLVPENKPVVADLGASQQADDGANPIYGKWWFWAGIGGAVVASVVVIAVTTATTTTVRDCGLPQGCDVKIP